MIDTPTNTGGEYVPDRVPAAAPAAAFAAPPELTLLESTPWSGRAIIHLDLDAFFAAVAQLDNPELRGRPVIVGGDPTRRGVVSTCSYEARAYGVRSAMPAATARRLCPDAVWVACDFDRYRQLSGAVMDILHALTPRVRQVSIDEAFADITPDVNDPRHPVTVARDILARVAELGITASIGLSTSMTLAKIGSDFHKPRGLTVIPAGTEAAFLRDLPVEKMSGIGPKATAQLHALRVNTLGELCALDRSSATKIFGKNADVMLERARGIDARAVVSDDPVKSVSKEVTFARDIRSAEQVRDALLDISAAVARRLRKAGLAGRTITLKLRFGDFTTRTVSRTLDTATDNEHTIAPVVIAAAHSIWGPGKGIRLLGVGVSHFGSVELQTRLFDDERGADPGDTPAARAKLDALTDSLDAIKDKFGEASIRPGRRVERE
ncbi:MAG: DNA polymerase IV [Actinomycetes bacterium]|jgi:DNA polymerase-4|nr:DNA polymerase IV [Actinomycetes bacterium]